MSEFTQRLHGNALALSLATTLAVGNMFYGDNDDAYAQAALGGDTAELNGESPDVIGKKSNREDWPSIDPNIIDGKLPDGRDVPVKYEQDVMANCSNVLGLMGPQDIEVKPAAKKAVRVTSSLDGIEVCNEYGQRRITMVVESRRPGQKKWREGKELVVETHAGDTGKTRRMQLAQALTKGSLSVRIRSDVSFINAEGETTEKTYRSPQEKLTR